MTLFLKLKQLLVEIWNKKLFPLQLSSPKQLICIFENIPILKKTKQLQPYRLELKGWQIIY